MYRIITSVCVIGVLATTTGCGKKRSEVTYDEVAPKTVVPTNTAVAAPATDIHWHVPPGWEKQTTSDGITAMSYSLGNATLTMTSLQGTAGGTEANIQRWRQQAGLPPFTPEELNSAVIKLQTGAGPAELVKVADVDTASKQIFGAILPVHGTTWFVKMTGPIDELTDARWQEFQSLLKAAHVGSH